MPDTNTTADLDETLQVLAAHYRRWTLYVLLSRDVGSLTELVPLIWMLTEAATGERVSETKLTIQLQQIHLPRLADAGLINYDHRSGDITLTERSDEIREQIETVKTCEEPSVQAEIP